MVDTCIDAAQTCMPKAGKPDSKGKNQPYWSDHVGLLREEALEAQWLWQAAGRPNSGILFDDMRTSRRAYHYSIKE